MAIIHTHLKKRKPKKMNARQREIQADWEKLVKKYETKPVKSKGVEAWIPPRAFVRETPNIKSLDTGFVECTRKDTPKYTGSAIKGIGTMHKSNAVPIFTDEQAIEIATMRRG
jgi:hypothetical protein